MYCYQAIPRMLPIKAYDSSKGFLIYAVPNLTTYSVTKPIIPKTTAIIIGKYV